MTEPWDWDETLYRDSARYYVAGRLPYPELHTRIIAAVPPTDRFHIRGGCLCGGVRYELRAPFRRANFCHCSRCRKHSGAAALAQGRVPASAFTLLQGRELLVTFWP